MNKPKKSTEVSTIRGYEDALPIALLRAREAVMARFRPNLSMHGLTEQQWRVIRAVEEQGEADATKLSEMCCILMPSLSRMLKTLEADGLVKRVKMNTDARRQAITLTQKGLSLFQEIAPTSEAIYADIEAKCGSKETAALVKALQDVQAKLEN